MQGPSSNSSNNQQQQTPTAPATQPLTYAPNNPADPWTYGPNGTGPFNGPVDNSLPDFNDTSRLGGTTQNWNAPSTIGGFTNPSPASSYSNWYTDPAQYLPTYSTPESLLNASYALPNAQDPANWPIFLQQIANYESRRGQAGVNDPFTGELKIRQMQAALAGSGYVPPSSTPQTPAATPTTQGDQIGDPTRWNMLRALPAYQNLDPSITTSLQSILGI